LKNIKIVYVFQNNKNNKFVFHIVDPLANVIVPSRRWGLIRDDTTLYENNIISRKERHEMREL
jgi:hypothetical protein